MAKAHSASCNKKSQSPRHHSPYGFHQHQSSDGSAPPFSATEGRETLCVALRWSLRPLPLPCHLHRPLLFVLRLAFSLRMDMHLVECSAPKTSVGMWWLERNDSTRPVGPSLGYRHKGEKGNIQAKDQYGLLTDEDLLRGDTHPLWLEALQIPSRLGQRNKNCKTIPHEYQKRPC